MDPDDEEDDCNSNCNSNLSSLSIASACASSVGGLSSSGYYEDELNSIRQLLTKRQGSKNVEHCKSFNKDLNEQLISALKLNEEYKNKLYKLEFEEHCKFKDLLEKNVRLSKDLEYANNLIKNTSNTSSEINYELYKELTYWKNEHIKLKLGQDKLLLENRKLLKELEESKHELNTKILGNKELKKKITEQHVENQITLQAKLGLFNELQSKLTELEFVKKSEEWYKMQLKQTQVDKQKINEELMCLKNLHINKTRQIESLQLEIQQQRGLYNELEFNYKKQLEKQEEQQKRQQQNRTEKHKEYANNQNVNVKKQEQRQKEELKKQQQKDDLQEIEIELTKVKQSLKEQHLLFNELNTKYADLSARNVFMQKTLNDKESTIDNLRNDLSKSNNKLSLINQELKQAYTDLSQLKLDKDKLQLHLSAALFEKNQTDSLINNIRKDFNKFVDKYNQLIKELKEKENTICGLQKEKQELFMNHNWQVCELEEAKNKLQDHKSKYESVIIENNKLKEELTIINQIQTTNNLNNLKYNQQNQHLVSEIKNLDENVLEQERQLQFNENNIRMLFEQDERFKCFHNFNHNKKEIEENKEAMNYNNNKAGGNVNNKLKKNEDQSLGIYVLNYLYLLTCKYSKNIDDEVNEEAAKRKEEDGNRDLMMETLNSLRIKIGEILSDIYVRKRNLFEEEQGQGIKEEKWQELELEVQGLKGETGQGEKHKQGQKQRQEKEQRHGHGLNEETGQEEEQEEKQAEKQGQRQEKAERQGQGLKEETRQEEEQEQGQKEAEQRQGQVQRQGLKEGKIQELEQKEQRQEQGQRQEEQEQRLGQWLEEKEKQEKLQQEQGQGQEQEKDQRQEQGEQLEQGLEQEQQLEEKKKQEKQGQEQWQEKQHLQEQSCCCLQLFDNVNVLNDEISYLKTKLKVMEREKADYQRKHEKINRTLLKKLKEHIKGRHLAEKSLLYLQKQTESIHKVEEQEVNTKNISINVENVIKNAEEYEENDKRKSDFCSSMEDSLETLKSIVNKSQAKLPLLTNDLELCKSELRHKNNEIITLNARIVDLVRVKEKADDAHEKLVNLFKLQIANLQESVFELKKEKTVMESVCQDLKLALKSKKSINQNAMCKKCRINTNMNTIEEKEYSSLPSSFPLMPSPSIFDDTYIVHLMQLSNNSQQQSSSSSSSSLQPPLDLLRHHLDSLKEEVSELAKVTATATAATTK